MKRIFDVVVSGVALAALLPFIAIIAICIRFHLGSPVLFRQVRPGRDSTPFVLIKFRTMRNIEEKECDVTDEQRIPPFGRMLRSTSLDELPELWNVLKGEMSLVGPRPLLMEYLPLYTQEQSRRHEVRPGITGWAQVNGRNALSWDEKFILDVWYADNQTFCLDLKILWLTIRKVIAREGVSHDGEETMPRFRGSER